MFQQKDALNRDLQSWFLKNRRDFPWRRDPTPYKVWISEIMLQQTKASVVIPFFERWMALFPDVKSVALSSFDELLKAWEGLGFYQRLRNIHRSAKKICEKFQGKIPCLEKDLKTLWGLGPYSRGAILAFGFRKRAAAVDGNALRSLVRCFQIEEDIAKERVKRKLFTLQEEILPLCAPYILVEAWIELGATICLPKARCEICPISTHCLSFINRKESYLPISSKKKETVLLKRAVLIVQKGEAFLIRRVSKGQVMADLWEFPYFDFEKNSISKQKVALWALSFLGLKVLKIRPLELQKQSFTKFRLTLFPFFAIASGKKMKKNSYQWKMKTNLGQLSFSSGHRKILSRVMEER
jgi:A/G-specific adenine glycosylase